VQLFHAHFTSDPTATVFVPGVNMLFWTEIPFDGGGVLPDGGLLFGGLVDE
jgi:hypothetical protein